MNDHLRRLRRRLHLAQPGLASAGLEVIDAEYNGSGDDGAIEELEGSPAEVWASVRKLVPPALPDDPPGDKPVPGAMDSLFLDLAWEALNVFHGGWENNEGGYGHLVYDVKADTLTLEHNQRYVEVTSTEDEIGYDESS